MKRLILLATLLVGFNAYATEMPYNPAADAKADVQHALAQAQKNHKPVLVLFGANWCPDCRALAASLNNPTPARRNAETCP